MSALNTTQTLSRTCLLTQSVWHFKSYTYFTVYFSTDLFSSYI